MVAGVLALCAFGQLPPQSNLQEPPHTVAVLVLSGDDLGVSSRELHSAARTSIEKNTALAVADFDVFSATFREAIVRQCAGDIQCFVDQLAASGVQADLLMTLSADRLGAGLLMGLRLVDTRSRSELGVLGEEPPSGASVVRIMGDYVARVFPPSVWGQVATLYVDADRPGAQVTVGSLTCVAPCRIERIRPGTYDVTVSKPDYQPFHARVVLHPRGDELVSAKLEVRSSWVPTALLWGGVAVGVAAIAAVAIVATRQPDDLVVCLAEDSAVCTR